MLQQVVGASLIVTCCGILIAVAIMHRVNKGVATTLSVASVFIVVYILTVEFYTILTGMHLTDNVTHYTNQKSSHTKTQSSNLSDLSDLSHREITNSERPLHYKFNPKQSTSQHNNSHATERSKRSKTSKVHHVQ